MPTISTGRTNSRLLAVVRELPPKTLLKSGLIVATHLN